MPAAIDVADALHQIYLETLELLSTIAINGQRGTLETVSNVTEVRDPS